MQWLKSTNTNTVLSSNGRVAGSCGNTTLVMLVSAHPDVSLHTPVSSPAVCVCSVHVIWRNKCVSCVYHSINYSNVPVLDNPVVHTTASCAIANSQYTVVCVILGAIWIIIYPTLVKLLQQGIKLDPLNTWDKAYLEA